MKGTKKILVSMLLSAEDHARLSAICEARGQSKADFLRAALEVHESVPNINTRPLSGACLEKHRAKQRRDKARERRARRKEGI